MSVGSALVALAVAFVNGANDNFKGVGTLYGSGTTRYCGALGWATLATFAGSLAALFLGASLARTFTGHGLLPDHAPGSVLPCAGLGAAFTVALASRRGLPTSTTHALLGGLLGAGLASTTGPLHYQVLAEKFVAPLLLSPALALGLTLSLYPLLSRARRALGVEARTCLCLSEAAPASVGAGTVTATLPSLPVIHRCERRYEGAILGIDAQTALDRAHYMSAGLASFSRGLNDTPKIAALLLAGSTTAYLPAAAVVGVAILLGGWWGARRVAETMSHGITPLNHGQGLAANAVTSALAMAASALGLPVSLTHVSVGALAGIGAATGEARWKELQVILLAWCVTLPLAALVGGAAYLLLARIHL